MDEVRYAAIMARRAGAKREDFAARSGLHRTFVGNIERGLKNTTILTLMMIAKCRPLRSRVIEGYSFVRWGSTGSAHGLTPIDRLTRRSQRQESHGVEHVCELRLVKIFGA